MEKSEDAMPRTTKALLCAVLVIMLTSCAHQPAPDAYDPPSFFTGLFNGFTIFFSLIGSIFWDVRIYAFPNNGGWYDFGFFLGAVSWIGAYEVVRR
jgi:hypothetical protein